MTESGFRCLCSRGYYTHYTIGQTVPPCGKTYTYDQLNRLATATENKSGVQQWKQSFTFDRWGNRSVDTANTTANVMPPALTYNTATNRITGPGVYGFDNAGNMTQDPLNGTTTYTFNGDNRVTTAVRNSVTVGTYTYDGEGRRVKRVTSTTTTRYIFDAGGKLAAEYTGATPTLDRGYVVSAVIIPVSQPAPSGDANNRTQYLTTDHLGSPRVITNAVGAVYSRRDFLPFGELIDPAIGSRSSVTGYSNGSTDGEKHKFTGKERDTETGNDFFEARYYRDILGRFTSPDPLNGTPNRPQSWNRYAYVLNNPLKLIDPSGMAESLAGGNRRYVNTFDEDTLGTGDDFAIVAGYTGGYEYGTIAAAVSDFTQESGVQTLPTPNFQIPPPVLVEEEGRVEVTVSELRVHVENRDEQARNLSDAQDAARQNPRFQPEQGGQGRTFCNFATCAVATDVGAPLGPLTDSRGNPALANTIARNLANSRDYREVTPREAQGLANQGDLVIAAQPNPRGHGHVATVRPNQSNDGSNPTINNIGRRVGVMPASAAFSHSLAPPKYYTPN